jgi:hypothetical protein
MGALSFLAASAPVSLVVLGFAWSSAHERNIGAFRGRSHALLGGPRDEVETSLIALGSPDADTRFRAERWLAAFLSDSDLADVAAALQNGTPATRDAVVRILASEDGLFGLAALVASDVTPDVARHGFAALVGQAARWSPALLGAPLADGDLPPDLGRGARDDEVDFAPRSITLALDRGGFADLIERIDRLALAPLPIVLDPELHPGVRRGLAEPVRPPRRVTAPWTEVLSTELARQRLTLRVHGFGPYDARSLDGGERPTQAAGDVRADEAMELLREAADTPNQACFLWLGLRGRGAEAPASERLAAWVTAVASTGGDPARREASARALASVRWPAATQWLALRWLATGDPAALEGTLAALARGHAEPRLATAAVVRALLDEVDRRLAVDTPGSQRFAERVGRALAALSPVDVDGQPLVDAVLAGFDRADATGRWARLVILEGQRRRAPQAAALARALLADVATPAPLAVQALATLRVVDVVAGGGSDQRSGAAPFVARPGALLAAAAEAGLGAEAGEWLGRVRARCTWTQGEVMAALEGGPTLGLLQLAATIGRSEDPAGALGGAVDLRRGADVAPWRDAVGRQLGDPVQRVELVHVARRAAELELFPGGDPRAFVAFMQGAAGGGGLAFELWRLDAGLADAGARRAALRRAEDLAGALAAESGAAAEQRPAAEALALAAGLVADRELGAAARELIVTLVTAACEGRGGRSDPVEPRVDASLPGVAAEQGRVDPPLAELTLGEAIDALTRAAEALGAARLDLEAEALFGALRGLAGRGWQSLAGELYGVDWPPVPPALGRDLDALERRYGR